MKRVEVKLSLPVVAPLLDVIKSISDRLQDRLAAPLGDMAVDEEMRTAWSDELRTSQNGDVERLLLLFDSEFFSSGMIAFDEENAESIVRACAAVRLQMREQFLQDFPDDTLETGDVELEDLAEPLRRIFMCYVFLATIQELIIQHLDSSILES